MFGLTKGKIKIQWCAKRVTARTYLLFLESILAFWIKSTSSLLSMWVLHGCPQFQVTLNQTCAGSLSIPYSRLRFASGEVFPRLKLLLAQGRRKHQERDAFQGWLRPIVDSVFYFTLRAHLFCLKWQTWCRQNNLYMAWGHQCLLHAQPLCKVCLLWVKVVGKKILCGKGFSCFWTVLGHEMCSCTFRVL